jgi:hypothetical protein
LERIQFLRTKFRTAGIRGFPHVLDTLYRRLAEDVIWFVKIKIKIQVTRGKKNAIQLKNACTLVVGWSSMDSILHPPYSRGSIRRT